MKDRSIKEPSVKGAPPSWIPDGSHRGRGEVAVSFIRHDDILYKPLRYLFEHGPYLHFGDISEVTATRGYMVIAYILNNSAHLYMCSLDHPRPACRPCCCLQRWYRRSPIQHFRMGPSR